MARSWFERTISGHPFRFAALLILTIAPLDGVLATAVAGCHSAIVPVRLLVRQRDVTASRRRDESASVAGRAFPGHGTRPLGSAPGSSRRPASPASVLDARKMLDIFVEVTQLGT